MKKYVIDIFQDPSQLDELISDLKELNDHLKSKANEIANRLAQLGYEVASVGFESAQYDGYNDAVVRVEPIGPATYKVIADGHAALFIEFGAGIAYNYNAAHPEAAQNGMGPGTYNPESDAWMRPEGWYMPGPNAEERGLVHTYGNPPEMPMYLAVKELEERLAEIAQEVFNDDRY